MIWIVPKVVLAKDLYVCATTEQCSSTGMAGVSCSDPIYTYKSSKYEKGEYTPKCGGIKECLDTTAIKYGLYEKYDKKTNECSDVYIKSKVFYNDISYAYYEELLNNKSISEKNIITTQTVEKIQAAKDAEKEQIIQKGENEGKETGNKNQQTETKKQDENTSINLDNVNVEDVQWSWNDIKAEKGAWALFIKSALENSSELSGYWNYLKQCNSDDEINAILQNYANEIYEMLGSCVNNKNILTLKALMQLFETQSSQYDAAKLIFLETILKQYNNFFVYDETGGEGEIPKIDSSGIVTKEQFVKAAGENLNDELKKAFAYVYYVQNTWRLVDCVDAYGVDCANGLDAEEKEAINEFNKWLIEIKEKDENSYIINRCGNI